jgi:hypothetical protein
LKATAVVSEQVSFHRALPGIKLSHLTFPTSMENNCNDSAAYTISTWKQDTQKVEEAHSCLIVVVYKVSHARMSQV